MNCLVVEGSVKMETKTKQQQNYEIKHIRRPNSYRDWIYPWRVAGCSAHEIKMGDIS